MQLAIIVIGAFLTIGMIAYALFSGGGSRSTVKRLNAMKERHSDSTEAKLQSQMRKAIAARKPLSFAQGAQMSRVDRLRLRLEKTGKGWSLKQYLSVSLAMMIFITAAITLRGAPLYLGASIGALIALAVPHMVVGFMISRRLNKFTVNFPDAIELLVRGLRSGLPVGETLGVVAEEIPGPVGEEFKMITDKIKVGKTMEDAMQDTADRLGTPEFQFFVITLAIQRETGGNLAETLSNLSDVLRKRAQMKLKIKAMSSESKASAYIVGSLPFIVFGLVWSVNPTYLGGFFYEPRLIIAGLIGFVWMGIGVAIMAKMVSFEI